MSRRSGLGVSFRRVDLEQRAHLCRLWLLPGREGFTDPAAPGVVNAFFVFNKAKVTMRRSYGFRTYRVLELALYHSLGKLPEPESTHDFF